MSAYLEAHCHLDNVWLNTPRWVVSGALAAPASLYDFSALQYEKPFRFNEFANCVTVVVNVHPRLLLDIHSMCTLLLFSGTTAW